MPGIAFGEHQNAKLFRKGESVSLHNILYVIITTSKHPGLERGTVSKVSFKFESCHTGLVAQGHLMFVLVSAQRDSLANMQALTCQ